MQSVDVKLQDKIMKDGGVRIVLGDALCVKPASREVHNHALNTLSARARATMDIPDPPRNVVRSMEGLMGTKSEANPYKGRCWVYMCDIVPKTATAGTTVANHVNDYMQSFSNQPSWKPTLPCRRQNKAEHGVQMLRC